MQCPPPSPTSPMFPPVQGSEPLNLDAVDRAFTGSSQYPITISSPMSQSESLGSEDSWSSVQEASSTGRSSLDSHASNPFEESPESLEPNSMQNLPGLKRQRTMSGRMTPRFRARGSNSAVNLSNAVTRQIGNEHGTSPQQATSWVFQHPSVFLITGLSEPSSKTLWLQLLQSVLFKSTGARLELGKVAVHGKRREWTLTLSLPLLSSGMATEVSTMLLSMNFVELSRSPTSCDGWIGTRSWWITKALPSSSVPVPSGLPPTCPPANGIPI